VSVPLVFLWLLLPARREDSPSFPLPRPARTWHVDPAKAREYRDRALTQARTWHATDPGTADFSKNPSDPSGLLSTDLVECRHLEKPAGGTSPKFDCALADGEVVRVKYGLTKEIHAEIAASRLLTALGFAADRVYSIQRLRCYGCAREPYYTTKTLDYVHARGVASKAVPDEGYTDFERVSSALRWRADRSRRRPGVGVVRAERRRRGGAAAARRARRAAPGGDAARALGQQGVEPATDVQVAGG
jgi:hypothetical protein